MSTQANEIRKISSAVATAIEALEPLGMKAVADDERTALVHSGFASILPLWTARDATVGLLAMPHEPVGRWRGVIVKKGQALTLASNSATTLPRFLVAQMLAYTPGSARRLAGFLSDGQKYVERLHLELGGDVESIEPVSEAARGSLDRLKFRSDRPNEFQSAVSTLLRQIDTSQQFCRFADWLDAAVLLGDVSSPPEDVGVWQRQAVCWTVRANAAALRDFSRVSDLIEEFAGLDTGLPTGPTWVPKPSGASGEAALVSAAFRIDANSQDFDEIGCAVAKALQVDGIDYDGGVHAEAAVALDERGEPERAWAVLNSAAWWMARSLGACPPSILNASRLLCDRHGWEGVRLVVDQNAGASL